ncbi:MAG: efflux RND transporter permease subunit, partial [Myxococcales bacterium]|nr:efflux RND transporter permease subunit [Myxococcales bacterium]
RVLGEGRWLGRPQREQLDQAAGDRGPHTAALTAHLKDPGAGDLVRREAALTDRLRAAAAGIPGAEVRIERPALFSLRPPIRVVIRGHHLGLLAQTGARVEAVVAAQPGVEDVQSSVRPGYPELQIRFDRPRLASLGLDPRAVAERLRAQVDGEIATTLRRRGELTDVRVRLDRARTTDREALAALIVNPGEAVPIPLAAVATLEPGVGPAEIRHVDGQRAAWITARTAGFDLGTAADRVAAALTEVARPAGFDVHLRGQDEEMRESLASLRFALLLAVFLVYVVMASQFESLRAPLVIMGSVPLAAVGVVALLAAYGAPLSVVVFVGAITLAGIVVNNAIVLVDYAQQLQARGQPQLDALVEAGRARLRPILMTTLTTVLGLLPMAFEGGPGTELRQPIALTLIGGLVVSTLLTLVVIP